MCVCVSLLQCVYDVCESALVCVCSVCVCVCVCECVCVVWVGVYSLPLDYFIEEESAPRPTFKLN